MSGAINYAKAKRMQQGRRGEPAAPRDTYNTRGWRVEYPEEFPVTRTVFVPSVGDSPRIPRLTGQRRYHRDRSRS